jgi:hypothetical protein
MMANAAPTPKAVAIVLLPALVLMLAFAFSYVGASTIRRRTTCRWPSSARRRLRRSSTARR